MRNTNIRKGTHLRTLQNQMKNSKKNVRKYLETLYERSFILVTYTNKKRMFLS